MRIHKRAFTLVELIVVVGIIALIFGSLMRFSFSRIQELNNQSQKEEFLSQYVRYSQLHLVSPYWAGKRYLSYRLSITSGASSLSTFFSGVHDVVAFSGFDARKGFFSWSSPIKGSSAFSATFVPYRIGCVLSLGTKEISEFSFRLRFPATRQDFCFAIESIPCVLRSIPCSL